MKHYLPITLRGLVLGALAWMPLAAVPVRADAPRPNIVLIFVDDQGYGDLGCYGAKDIKTPNIDRLANEGTRFTSFYVAQPVCTASRTALLTGCYPNRLSMAGALNHTSTVGIHPQETLLSQLCKQQGYATAVYGKWHLGHHPPFLPTQRGFDEFFGIPYSNDNGPLHPVTPGIPPLPLYEGENVVAHDPDQSQFTRRITERAVGFIDANKDRPFFLYVPHIMPHVPIFASEKFRGTSERGLYGDVIQELDWSVGEIMKALDKHKLNERTLVVYASDNGPFLSYGEHAGSAGALREGKLTTFEGGVRVPCIMRWPGKISAKRVCDDLVATMDLFATITKLIGAKPPERKIDGIDVSPLLLGEKGAKGRDVFWYYSGDELHAVRQGDWKLHLPHEYLSVAAEPGVKGKPSNFGKLKPESIELSGIRGIATRHGYHFEKIGLALYNLADDPGETNNLADKYPEVVSRLQAIASQARADLGDSLTKTVGPNVRPSGNIKKMEEGFVSLLSVNDTTGWVEEQHDFFRAKHPNVSTWKVRDGLVKCDGSQGNCGFLRYDKKLCDFVLRLEFRMSAQCNSGVGLRAAVPYTTLKPNTLPSNVGYEFQIMDDAGSPASATSTGSFYGKLAPSSNAARPAGEWNTLEIECRGPRLRATLNGQVVQNIDQRQVPALADRPQCGYLSLQNHGYDIEFRRIRLKEIEVEVHNQ